MSWWDDNPDLSTTGQGFDESGGGQLSAPNNEGMQLSQPTGVDPALMGGNTGFNGGGFGGNQLSAPTGGGFVPTQQNFLDWATQKYGADPTRGSGFVNAAAGGGLQNMIGQYNAANGTNVKFLGGPSGDRLDFGQGAVDALTSGGQIWNPNDGNASNQLSSSGQGMGGYGGQGMQLSAPTGGGSSIGMPTPPPSQNLTAPAPFTYQPSNLGQFQGPAPYQAPSPFQSPSDVPQMQSLGYNLMQAPTALQPQLFGTGGQPQQQAQQQQPFQTGGFRPSDAPAGGLSTTGQGFDETMGGLHQTDEYGNPVGGGGLSSSGQGMNESAGGGLSSTGQGMQEGPSLSAPTSQAAPSGQSSLGIPQLSYQNYEGSPTDSSYDFRFKQGLEANQNTLAHSGALRTGAAAKALTDYGQGMASTEYAAEDARRRANSQMNNAGNMAATQGNVTNQYNAVNANNAAQLGFGAQNFNQAFATNQANNQGQNAAAQGNNQNALAAQGQQYGQAANTYGMNASTQQGAQAQNFNQALAGYGANQAANQQQYNQALGAYGQNASTQFQYGAQNQNNALNTYQAQVAAALGQGNLNLGYQNSNNAYALGQGNLGIQQGQLGLQQQGQNFNQNLASWQQNYQSQVMDPWMMNYQLASLGNPGAPNTQGNANQQSDIIQGQGNANAASQIAQGNASAGAWNNLGNMVGAGAGYYQNAQNQPPRTTGYTPGSGQPLWY